MLDGVVQVSLPPYELSYTAFEAAARSLALTFDETWIKNLVLELFV